MKTDIASDPQAISETDITDTYADHRTAKRMPNHQFTFNNKHPFALEVGDQHHKCPTNTNGMIRIISDLTASAFTKSSVNKLLSFPTIG